MKKQVLWTMTAACLAAAVATGCGNKSASTTTVAETTVAETAAETAVEETTAGTQAADLSAAAEGAIEGKKYVAGDQSFQMNLPGEGWSVENQGDGIVTLANGSDKITITTPGAPVQAEVYDDAEAFSEYIQGTEALAGYDVIDYKNESNADGLSAYSAVIRTDNDQNEMKYGVYYTSTLEENKTYDVFAKLTTYDESTLQSVRDALQSFALLKFGDMVITPEEVDAAMAQETTYLDDNKYTSKDGSFSIYRPTGWNVDESDENMIAFTSDTNPDDVILIAVGAADDQGFETFGTYADYAAAHEESAEKQVVTFENRTTEAVESTKLMVKNPDVETVRYESSYTVKTPDRSYCVQGNYTTDNKLLIAGYEDTIDTFTLN